MACLDRRFIKALKKGQPNESSKDDVTASGGWSKLRSQRML